MLSIISSGSKLDIQSKDIQAYISDLLKIDYSNFIKEEYVKIKFFNTIGNLLSNDTTNSTFNICHDLSKAYYPHIIAQALNNLLEMT